MPDKSKSGNSSAAKKVKPESKDNGKSSSNGNGKPPGNDGASGDGQPDFSQMKTSDGRDVGMGPDGSPMPIGPRPSLMNGGIQSTANPPKAIISRILGVRTRNYAGPLDRLGNLTVIGDQPLFMRYYIPAMLRDPEIWYGIEMLKGPIISKAKYKVVSPIPEVSEYVDRQIKRFWTRGVPLSLSAMVYGYIGLETVYHFNKRLGAVEFKGFKYIHPNDSRPVMRDGALIGMMVKRIRRSIASTKDSVAPLAQSLADHVYWSTASEGMYLGLPKIFWAVHDQKNHRWFGRSRLEGAFIPWYECWQPQGFRSIRHGWFYRNCYDSGVIKHPPGSTPDEEGNEVLNSLLAQEMLDRRETGAGIAMENSPEGMLGWDYTPPQAFSVPEGLFDYGDSLRDEKWEGIGVPPEVAKAEATGSFAGRRVPQQAFYSFLQEIANEQMFDFDEQCLRWLVELNYGPEADYEIEPVSIMETLQQEEMGGITGHMPGDENDPFYSGGNSGGGGGSPLVQSGGRVEDRDSNAFNAAEQKFTQNAKAKK
jgi:hypothetical protein